jgi:hypothetical protein
MSIRSSEILRLTSGVLSSGIPAGESPYGLVFPQEPRERRRIESLSSRLMLSSLSEAERVGKAMPMTSANSDTEERRR